MITPQNLISGIGEYIKDPDEELIKKAYIFALKKHGTQIRDSGAPFFSHPLEVAEVLISLKMDQSTVIGGILHDTLEDTDTSIDEITDMFGEKIARIVDGVTKLSKFEISSLAEKQTENFKKLLLSAASDIRVLVIKLADRLHNMRTIKFRERTKRIRTSRETLEIYAPLAERIGIVSIKDELQDLAFMELYPEIYNSIKTRLKHLYEVSEQIISEITNALLELARTLEIPCSITGRLKTPYSIWEKMNIRNISFEQLSDIMAFRIVVDNIQQCYQMLGGIHRNYLVVPGRFRDYISTPKNNSYQSLHTSVIGPLNKRIEIQIRTSEMHLTAEFGVAAHSEYKTNGAVKPKAKTDQKWIRNLVRILEDASGMDEFLQNSKTEILSDKVFCITPKGTIVSLPKGASVLDFAYSIHSDVGNHAAEARINGKPVPLRTVIENGDQVEIVTDLKQSPKTAWESFVITIKAKTEIKKAMNALERERLEMIGKSNFDGFLQINNISITDDDLSAISNSMRFDTAAGMFYAIGTAQITMREVLSAYNRLKNTNLQMRTSGAYVHKQHSQPNLPIYGIPDVPILPVTCCSPVPGDKIVGVIFKDKGIEIHIEECSVLRDQKDSTDSRIAELSWSKKAFDNKTKHLSKLSVVAIYEPGNLSKIAMVVENKQGNIVNLRIGERFENFMQLQMELEVVDIAQLTMILADLRSLEFVHEVTRA
ncbi:MAG: RelA/SpoT family protein [Holosporales bacterium]|nr:RelA/SpoT family protein [Holosporales bacterium]